LSQNEVENSFPIDYEFHHLGYATKSIEESMGFFAFLGYVQEGDRFVDHSQGVAGCFLTGPGPRIELLENLPGVETLTPWITAGVKIYHFAYLVEDLDQAITAARQQSAKVIVPPVPATAFDLRRICFVIYRSGMVVEFIEKG